eukprot:gene11081-23166_t
MEIASFCCQSTLKIQINIQIPKLWTQRVVTMQLSEPIIAIDIGSTCVKSAAFYGGWPVREIPGGSFEVCSTESIKDGLMNPAVVFEIVNEVLSLTLNSLREQGLTRVKAVGFASLAMNIFGVDMHGEPTTKCFTYASHQHGIDVVENFLKQELHREDHVRTGAVVHSSYATVQLRAMADSSVQYPSVTKWQTLCSFIIAKWTGQPWCPISLSEASWTGLLDFRKCQWDERTVAAAHVRPETLPDVRDSRKHPIKSGLQPMYAALWPEMAMTPLYLGMGDGAAAILGSLCDRPSRVSITIGTSSAARVLVPFPVTDSQPSIEDNFSHEMLPPPGLWCYRVDDENVAVGGAMTDGGSLIGWLENLIGEEQMARAREKVHNMVNDADMSLLSEAPLVLPYWSGERSPGWHSAATGTMTGLTRSSDSALILYALKEAIALRLRAIISQLVAAHVVPAPPDGCLVASGKGLARSPVWRQIIADATGYPVVRLQLSGEATPRGIAVMLLNAIEGVSTYRDSNDISYGPTGDIDRNYGFRNDQIESITYPRAHMTAFYDQRYESQGKLYDHVISTS